jgi:hypothetical protein
LVAHTPRACNCPYLTPNCNVCREYMLAERVGISRRIILHKALYYYPERFSTKTHNRWSVDDAAYEAEELWYLMLTDRLGLRNELVHDPKPQWAHLGEGMLEIDWTNPDVLAALRPFLQSSTRSVRMGNP